MNRFLPIGLALALFVTAGVAPCRAQSVVSSVRDQAGMFSPEAVRQATPALQALERADHWQVYVETIDSLDGQDARDRAIADARGRKIHGLIVLISKKDHKFEVLPSRSAEQVFSAERVKAIKDTLVKDFKANDFDQGLRDLVVAIQKDVAAAASSGGGAARSGVRDGAKLFTPEAVEKANQALRALEREARWQVVIETIHSLDGQTARDRAIADAKKADLHGLIVLVSQSDHKLWVAPSPSAELVFNKDRVKAITELLERSFKEKQFDQGLLAAVSEIRKDAGVAPEQADAGIVPRPPIEEKPTVESPLAPVAALTPPLEKPATAAVRSESPASMPPAPASVPTPAPAGAPQAAVAPAAQKGSSMMPLILLGVGVLVFLWLLSRAFRRPQQPPYQYPAQGMGGPSQPVPSPVGSQPNYGPGPRPGAPPPGSPGYAPAGPAMGNPGYGPPGYGYGGTPPPPQRSGGGFLSGALGGLGGAIAGNILYDQFGRPHPAEGVPPAGGVHDAGGMNPPVHPNDQAPPPESYDPNAGAGGDWGGTPEQAPTSDDWSGSGDAGAGGTPTQEASSDPGAGGDWGSGDDGGAGGDWASGGSSDPAPDRRRCRW